MHRYAADMHREVELKEPVAVRTFQNVLSKNNLKSIISANKPFLTNCHKANRLIFAEDC